MTKVALTLLVAATVSCSSIAEDAKPAKAKPNKKGWVKLFDGKTLSGWTPMDKGQWEMNEGILTGKGEMGHLFSPGTYTNLEFKAEAKLNKSGNSGMYFRAEKGPGWPKGYEAQVENSSPDPQKTGSLYNNPNWNFQPPPTPVREQLIQDDTWWTQHIICIGNRIIVKVNGRIVSDFVDQKNTFKSGHLALQQHDPGSVVQYRKLMVKPLPSDDQAAWAEAKKETPEIAAK